MQWVLSSGWSSATSRWDLRLGKGVGDQRFVGFGVVIFHSAELGPPPVALRFTSGSVTYVSLPKPWQEASR